MTIKRRKGNGPIEEIQPWVTTGQSEPFYDKARDCVVTVQAQSRPRGQGGTVWESIESKYDPRVDTEHPLAPGQEISIGQYTFWGE